MGFIVILFDNAVFIFFVGYIIMTVVLAVIKSMDFCFGVFDADGILGIRLPLLCVC
ncbi:Uncharacterised protein [Neisseria gonorrhoeae]|nr:Uncharacterised protein [Neisseria gonorrhoeae]